MAVKASAPVPEVPSKATGDTGKKPDVIQVVEFALGNELFAIDLFDVKEVVEYTTITKLPNVPSYVRGIIDLRGEITTIVDLKQRLNITDESRVAAEASRIIVLDDKITKSKIGILVDDVTSVSTFEGTQVDYTSTALTHEDTAIIGIIKRKIKIKDKEKNELIIWINVRMLLEDIDAVSI
ncbi:MAG TPA: chemotaxis protein CheW [Methanoregula sp.]|nr:chemotaxis protein CheW [Methanoregula sp.]